MLSDSPRHLGKLNLSVPLLKEKIFAGAEFLYVSPRNTDVGTVAGGYGIVNLTLFSLALTLAMCLIAASLAIRRVLTADPAEVF